MTTPLVRKFNTVLFGKNLRTIMFHLEISQRDLAERAGLTTAAVSQIINGKREPSLETICKILEVIPTTFEMLVRA